AAFATAISGVLVAHPAFAAGAGDDEEEEAAPSDESTPAKPTKPEKEQKAEAENPPPAPPPPAPSAVPEEKPIQRPPPGLPPWQRDTAVPSTVDLELHGGMEVDIGRARYSYSAPQLTPESFYDFRGRFVLGAVLTKELGHDFYIRGVGQAVAWLREQQGQYQVNADDVFAQVGQGGWWDLMAGRFMSWRVYRKGLGYDLYTLEDTGALKIPTVEGGAFGPHVYEADDIFYREQAGRVALHLYPIKYLGFEMLAEYGKEGTSSTFGVRPAVNFTYSILSLSAAAETRTLDQAVDNSGCPTCSHQSRTGYAGGAVVAFSPIEAGFNYGHQRTKVIGATPPATPDSDSSNTRQSYGGYLEFDVGTLAFQQSLKLGFGANHTEYLTDDGNDYEKHNQYAAYVAMPLGFNQAMVKFVVSDAELHLAGGQVTPYDSRMRSGRFRFSMVY
ncbi:MAG TPA: hypothetical protein VHW01_03660, partial [Polyangiaceae bacterium]|nr:hypothetical protein [Polyangiaceae bacterium]